MDIPAASENDLAGLLDQLRAAAATDPPPPEVIAAALAAYGLFDPNDRDGTRERVESALRTLAGTDK